MKSVPETKHRRKQIQIRRRGAAGSLRSKKEVAPILNSEKWDQFWSAYIDETLCDFDERPKTLKGLQHLLRAYARRCDFGASEADGIRPGGMEKGHGA